MKMTFTKKAHDKVLAGKRRAEGETVELQNRVGRVFCAVGYAVEDTGREPAEKKTEKKKKKKTGSKKTYNTRELTAEKSESKAK